MEEMEMFRMGKRMEDFLATSSAERNYKTDCKSI